METLFTRVSLMMNIPPTLGGEIPVTENAEVLHGSRLAGYCKYMVTKGLIQQ
jgi:hypothetical protein